jgi:pimeloyl-ACP methyl ester carboxylesterase
MEAGAASGTVVLVHGGFVDGSGWQGVYEDLKKDGYSVAVVQNPTLSLEGDVAATNRVTAAQSEPVTLVGPRRRGDHRGGYESQGRGARLHRGFRPGQDRMIPPPAQRQMSERAGSTVVEAEGSHSIYVSKPDMVADLIERAASAVTRAAR